jgi:hypothetical protein
VLQAGNHAGQNRPEIAVAPGVVVAVEQFQEIGEVGRLPFAGDVAFGEADAAVLEIAIDDPTVTDVQRCGRAALVALERLAATVGQRQLEGAVP